MGNASSIDNLAIPASVDATIEDARGETLLHKALGTDDIEIVKQVFQRQPRAVASVFDSRDRLKKVTSNQLFEDLSKESEGTVVWSALRQIDINRVRRMLFGGRA
jgi:uncharacterized protein (DUF1810 family)